MVLLVFLITAILYFAGMGGADTEKASVIALGRAAAFFVGATFSWLVGYVGMSLAVRGNLRVAAAARTSYGGALQLGYRTGAITGMLTDGPGLPGRPGIFIAYREHGYAGLLAVRLVGPLAS